MTVDHDSAAPSGVSSPLLPGERGGARRGPTIERGTGRPEGGYRRADGPRVPSVTTVLCDHTPPAGLLRWAAGLAVDAHAAGRPRWEAIEAHVAARDESAAQGTAVHEVIQAHILGEDVTAALAGAPDPFEALACLERWREWEADRGEGIVWEAIEVPLVTDRVGGTPDMWGRMADGRRILGDLKAGKRTYRKHGRQLGLYRWMLREARGMEIDEAVILLVRPDAPVQHTQFGGAWLDAYEAAGLADLAAFEADKRCPTLPGMWEPRKTKRRT